MREPPHREDVPPNVTDWLFLLLRCPTCGGLLVYRPADGKDEGRLEHAAEGCLDSYPVVRGIPRLVRGGGRQDPLIAGFDDEWRRFRAVGTPDQEDLYAQYFDLVPGPRFGSDQTVLDAGCGAGRWAFAVANRGPRVIAIDLGHSVEVARANTDPERVACLQADVLAIPLRTGAVDWAYSLGVLHHTEAPDAALAEIVRVVRPGGAVLLYLYYALENRGPMFRTIFRAVDIARQIISRQPRSVVNVLGALIAASVYWPLARSAALLERLGSRRVAAKFPLSFYRHLSFVTMLNDSVDRFGTRLERRYTRTEVTALMEKAGLIDITISSSPPFWHGVGTKPA